MEKNNDTARSIVLRKSNNWDSPAEVIRAEHRMQSLSCRERRKRNYTKRNSEFWSDGKQALMSEVKKKCISTQHNDVPIEEMGTQNEQSSRRAQSRKKKKNSKSKKKENMLMRTEPHVTSLTQLCELFFNFK